MIAYFDTSAFVKLLIEESGSDDAVMVWNGADAVVASALLYPEARAAIDRGRRSGRLDGAVAASAVTMLHELIDHIGLVLPTVLCSGMRATWPPSTGCAATTRCTSRPRSALAPTRSSPPTPISSRRRAPRG